jgi:hypothetical protein
VVISAAARHCSDCDVAEASAAALWALSGCGEAALDAVAAQGAAASLVAAMAAHPNSLPLQTVACCALRNVAGARGGPQSLLTTGAPESILNALRLHGNSASLQEAGLDALAQLAGSSTEAARACLAAGALEVCKAALTTRFSSHAGVRAAAQRALDALSPARLGNHTQSMYGDVSASGLGATRDCHSALMNNTCFLLDLQGRLVSWLSEGGVQSDWLGIVELALTSSPTELWSV